MLLPRIKKESLLLLLLHQNVRCGICIRTFKTNRGLLQHLNFCRRRNSDLEQTVIEPEVRGNHSYDYGEGHSDGDQERFYWNKVAGSRFEALIHDAYEKIIQWKRNIFMLPTGASGMKYINETTRLFNLWVNNTPYELIGLKAIHVMSALLLQKPSKSSKPKEHLEALTRRLSLLNKGKIDQPLYQGQTIQDRLKAPQNATNISKISKKFKVLMCKGNVNGALKLLASCMSNGILPISNTTLDLLKQNHPEPKESSPETLLQGRFRPIHPVFGHASNNANKRRLRTIRSRY